MIIYDLKPYPVMKDSGILWLGKVPDHWRVERLKSLMANIIEQTTRQEANDIYIALERVESWTGRLKKSGSNTPFDSQVKRFRSGDVLFGRLRPYLAKVTRPMNEGVCVGEFLVLRPHTSNANAAYLEKLLRSKPIIEAINSSTFGAKMPRADWQFIGGMAVTLPPLPEQSVIVRFLDHMDRRIRRYILAEQRLIKLLEEYKQVIIHHAVTRGLDPTVPLKPSGVEWLGEVPEHWIIVQLRRLASFVTSGSRGWAGFYSESGDIFLQSGNLGRSMSLNLSFIQHVQPPHGSEGERTRVQRNDVLVCITGALTGNVVHVNADLPVTAFVNQHVALVRPNQLIVYPRYLSFVMHSEIGRIQFKAGEYGGTKQGLGLNDVKRTLVPLPPISEQKAICSELDVEIYKLTMAIRNNEHEISHLREYRTRLISDVVTGKLDVRSIELPSDEDAEVPTELCELLDDDITPDDCEIPEDEIPAEAD